MSETDLMRASGEGHTETVELLISKGFDLNVANNKGNTALMAASHQGHIEVA